MEQFNYLDDIRHQAKQIGVAPFAHNIIGLRLEQLKKEFNYSDQQLRKVIIDNGLDKKGWSKHYA